MGLIAEWWVQSKESVNWKIKQQKSHNLRLPKNNKYFCHQSPTGEEKEDEAFKKKKNTITKNLPNLTKNVNVQIQEARKSKRYKPRNIHTKTFHS